MNIKRRKSLEIAYRVLPFLSFEDPQKDTFPIYKLEDYNELDGALIWANKVILFF